MRLASLGAGVVLSAATSCTNAAQITFAVSDATGRAAADAVIYLSAGAPSNVKEAVTVDVDQIDREFVPRVTVVQAGTAIYFPNSDNIRHHVYSFSPAKTFTLKLYSGRPGAPVIFDQPGVVVLGCNIHDHMVAWVVSVQTPWFAKSDAQGAAVIDDLPAGAYEIAVWTPGAQTPAIVGAVEVRDGDRLEKTVTVQPAPAAPASSSGGAPQT